MLYLSKGRTIKEYIIVKFKSLLAPFWWWNILWFPIFFVLYYWNNWDIAIFIKGMGEIVLTLNKVPFLGATWFLAALFWVSVLVHVFVTSFEKYILCDWMLLLVGTLVAILGFQITLPYKISRILICALFYIAGYIYQKHIRQHITQGISTVLSILFCVGYIFIALNNSVAMGSNKYEHKIAFVIGAFFAIYFMIWFSEILAKLNIGSFVVNHIIYLGKNSMDIVIWHFLAFRVAILIQIIMGRVGVKALTAFPVYDASGCWWLIYLLTGIYGSLIVKYILEHNPFSDVMRRMFMIRK